MSLGFLIQCLLVYRKLTKLTVEYCQTMAASMTGSEYTGKSLDYWNVTPIRQLLQNASIQGSYQNVRQADVGRGSGGAKFEGWSRIKEIQSSLAQVNHAFDSDGSSQSALSWQCSLRWATCRQQGATCGHQTARCWCHTALWQQREHTYVCSRSELACCI